MTTATITTPEAPALTRAQLTNLAAEAGVGTRRELRALSTEDLRGLVAQVPPRPPRKAPAKKAAAKAPAKKAAAKAAPAKATKAPGDKPRPAPWTAAEDRIVTQDKPFSELMALLPGRSAKSIGMRRWTLKDPERAKAAQQKSRAKKAAPAKKAAAKATPRKAASS